MPRYEYYCKACDLQYQISHSYKDKIERCTQEDCDSEITKIMSKIKITKNKTAPKKIGATVNQSIKDFKEDLKREKETLKKKRK